MRPYDNGWLTSRRKAEPSLNAAEQGRVLSQAVSSGLEDGHWLWSIEDRGPIGSTREGIIDGFPPGTYLLLVDYTGWLLREGKASISSEIAAIFDRLGSAADT
jgi:hypothetical protein